MKSPEIIPLHRQRPRQDLSVILLFLSFCWFVCSSFVRELGTLLINHIHRISAFFCVLVFLSMFVCFSVIMVMEKMK